MTDEQGRRRGPLAQLKYPAAGGANSVLKTAAACLLRAIALKLAEERSQLAWCAEAGQAWRQSGLIAIADGPSPTWIGGPGAFVAIAIGTTAPGSAQTVT
jgi:hypothetical protein